MYVPDADGGPDGVGTPTPAPANNTTKGVTFTDTNGKTVTLPATANKIVVLNSDAPKCSSPSARRTRSSACRKLCTTNPSVGSYFTNVTNVGEWNQPNAESIAQLQPDVIISYASSPPKNMDQLASVNATISPARLRQPEHHRQGHHGHGDHHRKDGRGTGLRAVHPVGHRPGREPHG